MSTCTCKKLESYPDLVYEHCKSLSPADQLLHIKEIEEIEGSTTEFQVFTMWYGFE